MEAERRNFRTRAAPYDDLTARDARLVQAVTDIEQAEMGQWLKTATPPAPNRRL